MNSICDYCKANLQGIEFQARVRPKGNFNELLKEHGGSIKAVREVLTHHIDSRCTCDELNLKLQCALNQNNNDGPKNELDATLQQILNAYKNRDCNKESLLYLLRNTRVATDVHHCRDTLWKLSDVDLSQCQMCLLPASFGNILIGVRKLNLEMNNLHEIPTSLISCLHLEHLNLSRNRFTFLPSWLSNFKKLKHLNVGFNSFASILLQEAHSSVITATITKGVEKGNDDSKDWIEYVDYEQNRIVYFNKRSGEVNTKLKSRSKSNGYIQHTSKQSVPNTECTESINLPLQKVEVKEMVTLSNLRELKLNNNKFTSLPISVSHMTSLTVLKIQKNEITSLPSDLGNLVKLRVFDVSGNKLTTIPDLRNCIHLEEVDISSNYIDKFPDCILAMKNLQTLNISYNCIDRIPYKLGFHETLSTLNVYNNPIADPPYELLINNTNQALWECRELHLKQQQGDIPTIPIHNSGIRSERLALDPEFDAEIYQKIEEANLKSLNLELQNLNLSLIPYRVYTSKRIKGIHLQGNPLCTLDWKESSRNLMSLNLSDCKLKDISGSIKLLSNLERLHLEGNSLTLLPKEIVQLGRLKYLFLNNNALVEMPTELEGLSSLVELHLNHNCLKRLPESIHLLTDLEVICSSHNKLQSISSSITSMSKLKKLNLRQNNLKQIPKLGTLSLSHLLLSHNEIKRLDPDFFLPNLKKTLTDLELNGNNLCELPFTLPQCQNVFLDMNPLQSPPLSLINEGFTAIVKYCNLRQTKILEFCNGLKSGGFEIYPNNFSPPAKNVIGKTGFLRPKDLSEFDRIIDTSINGNFFYRKYSVKQIVKDIIQLKKRREQQTHKTILDFIISNLASMNASKVRFRNDIKKRFSMLENKVDCFAIPLSYVLLSDDNTSTIFNKVKTHLCELDSLFSFDNTMLRESFKFTSPFGQIASIENVTYSLGQNKPDDTLVSLVIAKHIYSEQEAARKSEEEKILFSYFAKMEDIINEWASTKQGIRSVNAEVSQRMKNIHKAHNAYKKELRSFRSESADKIKIMQRRLDDYDKKQPYDFHFITDDNAAKKLRSTLENTTIKTKEDIAILEHKYLNAKEQKENEKRITLRSKAIDECGKHCCHKIYEMIYQNGRALALVNDLNRPWDKDGFEEFKERCNASKESRIVLDENDLTNRIEKMIHSTDFIWTNLNNMRKYEDNAPYKKFKESPSFVEQLNVLKKSAETNIQNLTL